MRRVLSLFVSLLVAFTGSNAVIAQPEQILLPDDLNLGEGFGYDVAIDNDIAVIGVVNDNDGGVAAGAAYVFRLIGGIWEQEAKLIATDARPTTDRAIRRNESDCLPRWNDHQRRERLFARRHSA